MMRFTICGLRTFVDYVNETVPKNRGQALRDSIIIRLPPHHLEGRRRRVWNSRRKHTLVWRNTA